MCIKRLDLGIKIKSTNSLLTLILLTKDIIKVKTWFFRLLLHQTKFHSDRHHLNYNNIAERTELHHFHYIHRIFLQFNGQPSTHPTPNLSVKISFNVNHLPCKFSKTLCSIIQGKGWKGLWSSYSIIQYTPGCRNPSLRYSIPYSNST